MLEEPTARLQGTVVWYSRQKGFGFAKPDDGSDDVFLHERSFLSASSRRLSEGDRVEFSVEHGLKGPSAVDIKRIGGTAPHQNTEQSRGARLQRRQRSGRGESNRPERTTHAETPVAELSSLPSSPTTPNNGNGHSTGNGHGTGHGPGYATLTGSFDTLGLIEPLLRAIKDEGYVSPTPVQAQAIPHVLVGKDLLGCAQTGTGKTAAFALPTLQFLHLQAGQRPGSGWRPVRALVLAPTRELALQIGESFRAYGRHVSPRSAVIFGGVRQTEQVRALQRGVDILIATPGRLLDLMGQGFVSLKDVGILVLDEADRMLDMGFIHDVRRIVRAVPAARQTLFFSATMAQEVIALASDILHNPVRVSIEPERPTVEAIQQGVYFVAKKQKQALLEQLLADESIKRAIVFSRTKHGANRICRQLADAGIKAEPIHGNKSQGARQQALANFRSGKTRILVATDVAARGLDIDDVSHVIQFDLPHEPETYIHRIGRTGRAGADGMAVTFCDAEERKLLSDIERLIRQRIPVWTIA